MVIPMPQWVLANDYTYLFVISFLAATFIPLGSEWLLAALIPHSSSPIFLVGVASIGNVMGAWTTYAIGRYGGGPCLEKLLGIKAQDREKATAYYKKYGSWSLLFSFLPIIGDPLCFIGGLLRVPVMIFLVLVSVGKSLRYLFILLMVNQII